MMTTISMENGQNPFLFQIECKPALLKDEVTTTEPSQREVQQTFSSPARGGHMGGQQRGHPMMGNEQQLAMRSQMQMQRPIDSDGESGDKSNNNVPKNSIGPIKGKVPEKPERRGGQDTSSKPDGSENNDSQPGGQVQPMYDFQGSYGSHPPPPYNYQGYNYQMPPQVMGGQGYGGYQGYPQVQQRPPMKQQYGGYQAYNHQERGYPQMMGAKGMAGSHEFYDDYNYGGEQEVHPIRGGHMEPHGYPMKQGAGDYMRQDKRQKLPMQERGAVQHPPYQYGAQQINPMYQNMNQGGHFDARAGGAYDYSNSYKPNKSGETGIPQNQANMYNYAKTNPQVPYSYGNNYARNTDKGDQDVQEDDNDANLGQSFREDVMKAQRKLQQAKPGQKLQAGDDKAAKGNKPNNKQFAEDLDKKIDN